MRGGRGPGAPGACAGTRVLPSLSSLGLPTAALASLSLRSLASTASTRDAAAPRRHRRAGVGFSGAVHYVFLSDSGMAASGSSSSRRAANLVQPIFCSGMLRKRDCSAKNERVSYELVDPLRRQAVVPCRAKIARALPKRPICSLDARPEQSPRASARIRPVKRDRLGGD